MNKNKVNWY